MTLTDRHTQLGEESLQVRFTDPLYTHCHEPMIKLLRPSWWTKEFPDGPLASATDLRAQGGI